MIVLEGRRQIEDNHQLLTTDYRLLATFQQAIKLLPQALLVGVAQDHVLHAAVGPREDERGRENGSILPGKLLPLPAAWVDAYDVDLSLILRSKPVHDRPHLGADVSGARFDEVHDGVARDYLCWPGSRCYRGNFGGTTRL